MLDLGDPLDHHGGGLRELTLAVNRVAHEQHGLDLGQLGELGDLVPDLDSVIGGKEGVQLDAGVEPLELLDLVVRDPELLQSLADLVESYNTLDVVSAEREDFEALELGQVDDSFNLVGRQTQLLAGFQLVK